MKVRTQMPPWHPIMAACHSDQPHKGNGLCKKCYDAQYKRADEAIQKHRNDVRKSSLKHLYGITEDDYSHMLNEQSGGCKICGKPPSNTRRLCIDHDHITGKVRGLLCVTCNHVLSYLENPDWHAQATKYLNEHTQ